MALKQKITDNSSIILRCLDPSNELLGTLRSVPFMKDRIPSIVQQATINDKTNTLLTALSEVPDNRQESVMHVFIAALRANGQDHVANIFHKESDKVPMSDEHYMLLNEKMYEICQFLEPRDGLIDWLLSSKVFTGSNSDILLSKLPVDDMARETIKMLQRKSDDSFEKFISALIETEQDHLVRILTGTGRSPMSREHRKLLQSKKEELEMFCDPVNGVISALAAAADGISPREESRIRSKIDLSEMTRELVLTLMRKPDDTFDALLKALDKTGQSHVTYILTGEGDSQPLSEECRAKLIEKRSAVVRSIYPQSLVSTLISKGVFSSHDQRRVERHEMSNTEKGEVIVDLIARKSQSAFDGFIDTLIECHHEHVAEALVGPEVVGEIEPQFAKGKELLRKDNVEKELGDKLQHALVNDETEVKQVNEVLSAHGISVTDVEHGSIIIKFRCRDHSALASLEKLCMSKQLDHLFTNAFCSWLAEKGLEALCLKIADEELQRHKELKLMTEEHREALLSSADHLIEKLTINDALLDKLSLCPRRRQTIERAGTPQQQVTTLLDIVSRQPDSAFTQLLNALTTTEQHEAVTIISGGYEYIKTQISRTKKVVEKAVHDDSPYTYVGLCAFVLFWSLCFLFGWLPACLLLPLCIIFRVASVG